MRAPTHSLASLVRCAALRRPTAQPLKSFSLQESKAAIPAITTLARIYSCHSKAPLNGTYQSERFHHCSATGGKGMLPPRPFTEAFFFRQTILNPKSCAASAAKYSLHRENSDLKLANTESTLIGGTLTQCATTGRRRKTATLSSSLLSRSARAETKELRSALADREAAIQNLRIQLCLGKLPRPTGPPMDEAERPAAEQKLQRLKAEAENKKIKIRNLKGALDKLDITDNIDSRIRQAELEYALGREELQMLSIVEEARALQARLERAKTESSTLYGILNSGITLSLHAVQATTGRWAAIIKTDVPGFYVDWALEGDGLYKGDRILEVNSKLITCKTKEELQKIVGNSGKCEMVVLRKKTSPIPPPQKQLDDEKENSMRMQHRISYLEEQVKELLTVSQQQQQHQQQQQQQQQQPQQQQQQLLHHQQQQQQPGNAMNGHVTSISITSPPTTPPEKPLIFQRGNYITTLVGGRPIELMGESVNNGVNNGSNNTNNTNNVNNKNSNNSHITKTLIKENTSVDLLERQRDRAPISYMPPKSLSASKISINSDSAYMQNYRREKERQRRDRYESASATKASILAQRVGMQARSVEHLNHYNGSERRREHSNLLRTEDTCTQTVRSHKPQMDLRSVKSLDFDHEIEVKPIPVKQHNGYGGSGHQQQHHHANNNNINSDAMSDCRVRPTPPKKPLRLSLQRAQSLQTVEVNPQNCNNNIHNNNNNNCQQSYANELDKKRPAKRTHHMQDDSKSSPESTMELLTNGGLISKIDGRLIENCAPLKTASLGRQKHNI